MNFDHLDSEGRHQCEILIMKINFNLELLKTISGQAFELAPVKQPKSKVTGENEGK